MPDETIPSRNPFKRILNFYREQRRHKEHLRAHGLCIDCEQPVDEVGADRCLSCWGEHAAAP